MAHDRISDLPDELLLQILVFLPLVEAVRTCMLSHRWRHIWTRLLLLEFADDEASHVSSFESLVACVILRYATDVVMPDVSVSVRRPQSGFTAAVRIAACAFLAEQRANSRFSLYVSRHAVNLESDEEDENDDEEEAAARADAPSLLMPCFPWVTEFSLTFPRVNLRMPNTGSFNRLTKLYVSGVLFTDDGWGLHDVVSRRCPYLQDLELQKIDGLKVLFLLSQSVQSLRISKLMDLERLLVSATSLREMQVTKCFVRATEHTVMLLNVPVLEQFRWEDRCPDTIHCCMLPSKLLRLNVIELPVADLISCGGRSQFTSILQIFGQIWTLSLEFPIAPESADQRNLIENADISFFRELDLTVKKNAHIFGPTVLRLLNKHKWVRKLSLQITDDTEVEDIIVPPCASDCDCQNMQNGSDNITLDYLNWIVMKNFCGTDDETNFLYSVVRKAKALCKVSVAFSVGVEPTERFLQTLQKQSPSGCTVELATS